MIRWILAGETLDLSNIKDFHIYVLVDRGTDYVYFGRTGDGAARQFEWKQGSPRLAPQFQKGPQFGRVYRFRIYPMTTNGEPAFYGPFTANGSVTFLPFLTVTDDATTTADLSNGFDADPVDNRNLAIRWNVDPTDIDFSNIQDFHIYVQTDKAGNYTYLGRTGNSNATYFLWTQGSFYTSRAFLNGPQFGHAYSFRLYIIKKSGTPSAYGPGSSLGPVEFQYE